MRLSREGLERLRRPHLGYRLTLVVELLLLGLLPLAQRVPGLLPHVEACCSRPCGRCIRAAFP